MRGAYFWRMNWLALLSALAIVALGLPYLRSAATGGEFERQLHWLAAGLVLLAVFAAVDYRFWLRHAYWLYAAALLLLLVVLLRPPVQGARSWLRIGGLGVQPAEACKFALLLALARLLADAEGAYTAARLGLPFALVLAPMALVLKQPDLGTAMTLWAPLFAVVVASGARPRHLAAVAAAGAAAAVPLWLFVMTERQQRLVRAWLDPESGLVEAQHLQMSLMAVGGGGLLGQGLGQGTLNDLRMLPERHNDFIFAVIAEEGGLMRAGALLGLYALFALAGFHVASRTPEPGGRLLAVGVAAMIAGQAFLNVAVVTGLLPTTGITLPFVSYGGSSLVVSLAMVGLLVNVSAADPGVVWGESFLGRERRRGEL